MPLLGRLQPQRRRPEPDRLDVNDAPGLQRHAGGGPLLPGCGPRRSGSPSYSGLAEQASPAARRPARSALVVPAPGAGTHPVYLPGKVYLAGPYKGAPLSLAVVTPAVSGPFDLGNVVVRAAIEVDPDTAQVTAISDPLPQILEGIPLRLRSSGSNLNRRTSPSTRPTATRAVSARSTATKARQRRPANHFQVANCATLPFAPKLTIKLPAATKRAATRR